MALGILALGNVFSTMISNLRSVSRRNHTHPDVQNFVSTLNAPKTARYESNTHTLQTRITCIFLSALLYRLNLLHPSFSWLILYLTILIQWCTHLNGNADYNSCKINNVVIITNSSWLCLLYSVVGCGCSLWVSPIFFYPVSRFFSKIPNSCLVKGKLIFLSLLQIKHLQLT